jgi:ribosomal protein S13
MGALPICSATFLVTTDAPSFANLAKDEWQGLIQAIEKHAVFEIHRRRQIRKSIENLIEIKSHQAKKHLAKIN